MSYLALARRYRPRTFDEVVGQAHVVRALTNALEQGRLHHAWLFSGTRGVGKTTIARILARCLNCERGVSAQPCGECGACKAILEGRFVDLVEVDAASRTRVEETRDLLEGVPYAPALGRYKVYLIDEVHMLSNSSFNALLKTLEEPPEHVKFLFATTNPEKMPLTVLSRCLAFSLHRLPVAEIEETLGRIVEKEGLQAEAAALSALARAARGSVRDGLSLLDQALAFGGDTLSGEEVAKLLGTADREAVYDLLDCLAAADAKNLLARLADTLRGTNDPEHVLDALAETLAITARHQLVPDAPLPGDGQPQRLQSLAAAFPPEVVQLNYDIAIKGRYDLARANDPDLGLEMILLRMLAFHPHTSELPFAATTPATSRAATKSAPSAATASSTRRREDHKTAAPKSIPAAPIGDDWEAIVAQLEVDGLTRQLAQQCSLQSRDDKKIQLLLADKCKKLLTEGLEKTLEAALAKVFGQDCKLLIKIADGEAVTTPAARQSARDAERQTRAEQAIAADSHVAALREAFDAQVIPNTIRPEE